MTVFIRTVNRFPHEAHRYAKRWLRFGDAVFPSVFPQCAHVGMLFHNTRSNRCTARSSVPNRSMMSLILKVVAMRFRAIRRSSVCTYFSFIV